MPTWIDLYEKEAAPAIAKARAVQIPNGYYLSDVCFFTILNRVKAALGARETVTDAVYDAVTLAFQLGYLKGGAGRVAREVQRTAPPERSAA